MSKNNIIIGSKLGDGNILIGTIYGGVIPPTTTTTTTAGPTTTTTTTTTSTTTSTTTTTTAAPITEILCMCFSHQTSTNPHSRIIAVLNGGVGGMVCIDQAFVEGYNVGGGLIASASMGVTCTTCICFDGLSSGNCSAKTDQTPGDDASWASTTGYSYSAPAVRVNGTLISVCPTTISVGSNFVEVRFPISCRPY